MAAGIGTRGPRNGEGAQHGEADAETEAETSEGPGPGGGRDAGPAVAGGSCNHEGGEVDMTAARRGGAVVPEWTATYGLAVKSIDEDTRTVGARLTDESVDRMAETIPLAAWRKPLPASVPALWAHDWHMPALGRWHGLQMRGDGLYALATFAPAGTHPEADLVYNLVKAGVIGDVSVGFRAQRDVGSDGAVTYRDAELLEASFCNIGANPRAVVVARALGLDARRLGSGRPRGRDDEIVIELTDDDGDDVILLDFEPGPADSDPVDVDPTMLATVLREVVADEMRKALNKLRGRID
jgi:uncharacterized protein